MSTRRSAAPPVGSKQSGSPKAANLRGENGHRQLPEDLPPGSSEERMGRGGNCTSAAAVPTRRGRGDVQGETLEDITNFLQARYGRTQEEARLALRVAKLRRGESIFDYGNLLLQ